MAKTKKEPYPRKCAYCKKSFEFPKRRFCCDKCGEQYKQSNVNAKNRIKAQLRDERQEYLIKLSPSDLLRHVGYSRGHSI